MTASNFRLVRYADDSVVMCNSEEEAIAATTKIQQVLSRLKLSAEIRTVRLSKEEGTEFLGFKIFREHKVPREKSLTKFKDSVRAVTRRNQPINVKEVIQRLNPIVRGWGNYFKIANVNWLFKGLDSWTRMRLRSFIEKKKSYCANNKFHNKYFSDLGLQTLSSLIGYPLTPCKWATANESRIL